MSGAVDSWPALSFLEGLRPGPDENVELALLASYSADLGSIGATLLALAGKDTDAGRGTPSDFADAVERLRGKVRIVIQRGRLAKMHKTLRLCWISSCAKSISMKRRIAGIQRPRWFERAAQMARSAGGSGSGAGISPNA